MDHQKLAHDQNRLVYKLYKTWLLVGLVWLSPTYIGLATAQVVEGEPSATKPTIHRHPSAVPIEQCFQSDQLNDEDRQLSDKLLLAALDGEALYTLVGGIKPVSEGFFSTRFRVDPPDLDELAQLSRVLRSWQCGDELAAGVLVFENLNEGERFAGTWIASRPALARQLDSHRNFFGRLGLMPDSDPKEVLLSVERARDPGERWRGFGLLFGYPEFAVDFFVRAGLHQQETGRFVERDFRQYPTFQRETGGFVYAVPQLTAELPEELELRSRVLAIQGYYRTLRPQSIDDEQQRPLQLIRHWFDDGHGWCHPHHAVQKVLRTPGLHLGIWTADHRREGDFAGAKVRILIPGSAADQAGLLVDDVIRSINDNTIRNAQDYLEQVAALAFGQTVAFAIERPDGDNPTNHITISLKIPESPSLSEFLQESRDAVLER